MAFDKMFTLTYRRNDNPHPMVMHFQFDGLLAGAINRGRQFCEVVGYRFHSVHPMIVDFDKMEKRHLGINTESPAQPARINT